MLCLFILFVLSELDLQLNICWNKIFLSQHRSMYITLQITCWLVNVYFLSGCNLIDTENISLPSQDMKFVSKWAKRKSHNLHFLSCRLIFFRINHIHIQILKSNKNTDIWYIYWFRYLYFRGKDNKIQNMCPHSLRWATYASKHSS